jgi:iron complex transport system substrate-binding protein
VLAPVVSIEELIVKNPEVIIGGARADENATWLREWQKWPTIDAVKNNQLHFINPDLLNRQTSRMLEGAKQLCSKLENVRQIEHE